MPKREFFVAFEGGYEDPHSRGALAGPYPTLRYARDWINVLRIAIQICGAKGQKRPLYIIRVRAKP